MVWYAEVVQGIVWPNMNKLSCPLFAELGKVTKLGEGQELKFCFAPKTLATSNTDKGTPVPAPTPTPTQRESAATHTPTPVHGYTRRALS